MREKPVNRPSLNRTIAFLRTLHNKCNEGNRISLDQLASEYQIARGTGAACLNLNIIQKAGSKQFQWTSYNQPMPDEYKHLALLIKDQLLHSTKKSKATPLMPEWATMVSHLKEISDKLSISITQTESSAKRFKMPHTLDEARQANLFTEEQQRHKDRVYLAGKITSALIQQLPPDFGLIQADNMTDDAISMADMLLEKLSNENAPTIKKIEEVKKGEGLMALFNGGELE